MRRRKEDCKEMGIWKGLELVGGVVPALLERREVMKNMSNEELINLFHYPGSKTAIKKLLEQLENIASSPNYIAVADAKHDLELLHRLEEGEDAKAAIEILCYISLGGGIISRGKACEFMGIGRAELDEKLGEIQLGIAKRNIDLVDFYQNSKA